jgi:hypothetical protein
MKILLSCVAALALAVPCQAGFILMQWPWDGAMYSVGDYVSIGGTCSGTFPPPPTITVQISIKNGDAWDDYGYCTAQLDLETGAWVTGFSPELVGEYRLRACLYQGTDLSATSTGYVEVFPPVPPLKK